MPAHDPSQAGNLVARENVGAGMVIPLFDPAQAADGDKFRGMSIATARAAIGTPAAAVGDIRVTDQPLASAAAATTYHDTPYTILPAAGVAQTVLAGASTFAMAADGTITFAEAGFYLIELRGEITVATTDPQHRLLLVARLLRGGVSVEQGEEFYVRDPGTYDIAEHMRLFVPAGQLGGYSLQLSDLAAVAARQGSTVQFRGRLDGAVRGNPVLEVVQLGSLGSAPMHNLWVGWSPDTDFTDDELGTGDDDHSLPIPAAGSGGGNQYLGIWRSDADGGDPTDIRIAGSQNLRNTFTAAVARAREGTPGQFIRSVTTQNTALLAGDLLTVT